MRTRILLVMFSLFVSGVVAAADSGTISTNTQLYQQPDGSVSGTLLANTLVEISARRGGWYQVSASGGRQGWVRLGAVRLSGQEQSESVFSGLWGWLNSGYSVQSGGTATAGIRGLDAGDIESASADHGAVDSLNRFAVDEQAARRYAASLPLKARKVADLKERKK
ncbi:SH3 domain-containing protein [Alcanivorax sp. 1008]|uniref:SH3 domain-containing protein n=1 Tax=Alcanivorax sp. 1008 TaxID=2816853 RepID=UPI001DE7C872|nr:SH3 domain-containing protein [Alcanivorax sp. 1008]MCC1496457.1 SH3 domain-containing protein [Alcanivorax sp. 1008]